jgi:hypothetical protein
MAGRTGKSLPAAGQKPVSPQAIAVAVVLLVLIVGWLAYRSFGPFTPPKTFTVQDQKAWVAKLAAESGGDFTKLTPAERDKLNAISFGNGERYLKATYRKQTSGGGK